MWKANISSTLQMICSLMLHCCCYCCCCCTECACNMCNVAAAAFCCNKYTNMHCICLLKQHNYKLLLGACCLLYACVHIGFVNNSATAPPSLPYLLLWHVARMTVSPAYYLAVAANRWRLCVKFEWLRPYNKHSTSHTIYLLHFSYSPCNRSAAGIPHLHPSSLRLLHAHTIYVGIKLYWGNSTHFYTVFLQTCSLTPFPDCLNSHCLCCYCCCCLRLGECHMADWWLARLRFTCNFHLFVGAEQHSHILKPLIYSFPCTPAQQLMRSCCFSPFVVECW